jgi:CRISPR/Cas system CSM-associated protein Csm5 (group 7 of RAMP superfamily)
MVQFGLRLKSLRKVLSTWSRQAFGDIFQVVRKAEDDVLQAEIHLENDNYIINGENLEMHKAAPARRLVIEEEFWKQKTRVIWAKEGDQNSAYFHACVQSKRKRLTIHSINKYVGTPLDAIF